MPFGKRELPVGGVKKEHKYLKPRSLTWWSGFVPVGAGMFLATSHIHGLGAWSEAIQTMAGGMTPSHLILTGTGLIGVRGALE